MDKMMIILIINMIVRIKVVVIKIIKIEVKEVVIKLIVKIEIKLFGM